MPPYWDEMLSAGAIHILQIAYTIAPLMPSSPSPLISQKAVQRVEEEVVGWMRMKRTTQLLLQRSEPHSALVLSTCYVA